MRLHDVANVFNNMVCTDAYTGETLFSGQLGLYDDNKRDSETAERRVLSLSPSVVLPARRAIAAAGTRFILGHGNPDDYRGSTIRVGHVVHEAPYLSQVRTLAQVCLDLPGFTAYAGRAWIKDLAYTEQSSEQVPQHHIHFSQTEPVLVDHIVTYESRLNLVRSVVAGSGGTLVLKCEEMVEPVAELASIVVGVYDPVQDTTTGAAVVAKVVRMRWQSLFAYHNTLAPKFGPGDIQVAVAKVSATVVAGSLLGLSDGAWRVESAVGEGSVWLCRATRYG